jgi:hypothetical protein
MNSKRRKYLARLIAKARAELDEDEGHRLLAERLPFLGKCFKYDNGYSNEQRWPMYSIVMEANSGGFTSFSFQHMANDEVEVNLTRHSYEATLGQEVSPEEVALAWVEVNDAMSKASRKAFASIKR